MSFLISFIQLHQCGGNINKTILITGGSGFVGDLLKRELLNKGFLCINIDLEKDTYTHPNLTSYQGSICDSSFLNTVFSKHKFDAILHVAAILAHAVKDKNFLWDSNVGGTRNIAEFAKKYSIPKVIFTSSNCLWGNSLGKEVTEEEAPNPVEIYGKSKWESEKVLMEYKDFFKVVIFRCPTIIDSGRLGLLAILFEFINDGKKIWVVGEGDNRYQFIYAPDLINACIKALDYNESDIFNIGSDNVKSFKQVYDYVLNKAGTGSRVAHLPKNLTLFIMKLAYKLNLSPLGPYHYKMISESFIFNTTKIKQKLAWIPTLTNEEMLFKAYTYYQENLDEIKKRKNCSAHRKPASMGIIRVLKLIS